MSRSFHFHAVLFAMGLLLAGTASAQVLYHLLQGVRSRMASPENPTVVEGQGTRANHGAKGHAFDRILVHGHLDLLDVTGAGVIRRIKLTVDNRSSRMLRSLRIAMYWDGAEKPAVSAPLGDFVILPRVHGRGMYPGTNIGVNAEPTYGDLWWGKGEVKMYLDGDRAFPSIAGTGTEDYFGTAWGTGKFIERYSGCIIADKQHRRWACCRHHVPDPVYFHTDIKVTVQQIGGGPLAALRKVAAAGVPVDPISVDASGHMVKLKDMSHPPRLTDKDFPHGWTNFFRRDDWCATAYFYLDRPTDDLPRPASLATRIRGLRDRHVVVLKTFSDPEV